MANPRTTVPDGTQRHLPDRGTLRCDIFHCKPRLQQFLVVDWVANDRAGHAVPATATSPEFGANDRDHLNSGLAEQGVSISVAVVSENHAGRSTNEICAAVPLGALAHVVGAAGLDHAHGLETQRLPD